MEESKVIKIKVSTKKQLDKLGTKKDTYDSIIRKLLEKKKNGK